MNEQPKREGFIDDRQASKPASKTIEHEVPKPRPMPPPEIEPSPADQPALFENQWPMTIPLLNKPIFDNDGKKITELTLREPRAGDINRYGNPVRINQDGDVVYDERKMTYIIGALSGVLAPFIEDMHPRDWNTVAMKLRNFFLPDPRAW